MASGTSRAPLGRVGVAGQRVGPGTPSAAWPRWLGLVLAAGYLGAVWLDAVGVRLVDRALPAPIRFFTQVAELFPRAADDVIEWRAKGWLCDRRQFDEIDVRPFFPIRANDKESRFHRAMFFYYREGRVLRALDAYITAAQNRWRPQDRIGGVMLLSLRIPIPPLGVAEPRYERRPISSYPASLVKRYWYVTGAEAREQRCKDPS
jgi:hypothetical protein